MYTMENKTKAYSLVKPAQPIHGAEETYKTNIRRAKLPLTTDTITHFALLYLRLVTCYVAVNGLVRIFEQLKLHMPLTPAHQTKITEAMCQLTLSLLLDSTSSCKNRVNLFSRSVLSFFQPRVNLQL